MRLKPLFPLFFTALFLTSCATVADYTPSQSPAQTPAPTSSAEAQTSSAPTPSAPALPPLQLGEQVYMTVFAAPEDDRAVFSPEYRLPRIENAENIPSYEAINAYYANALEDLEISSSEAAGWALEDYSIAQKTNSPFYEYVDSETYEVTLQSLERLSVLRTHTANLGGPYPADHFLSDTFDLTTGQPLALADLFSLTPQESQELVLSNLLALNDSGAYANTVLDADTLEANFDPQRFYLTEDSLVLYYPRGVFSAALGSPTFAIPYADLEEVLLPWE